MRDLYAVDEDRVLLLSTDRVSAFDVVMAETIPIRARCLTQITAWWFSQFQSLVRHHMIRADADKIIAEVPVLAGHAFARRTRDAVSAHDGVPHRMRGPRLLIGLGVEGVR